MSVFIVVKFHKTVKDHHILAKTLKIFAFIISPIFLLCESSGDTQVILQIVLFNWIRFFKEYQLEFLDSLLNHLVQQLVSLCLSKSLCGINQWISETSS